MVYYFLVSQFDTDAEVRRLTKEQLIESLNDGNYPDGFLSKLEDKDPATWEMKSLLIKGEIVVPVPKQVVEEWEVQ